MNDNQSVTQLIAERDAQYGSAWASTGGMLGVVLPKFAWFAASFPEGAFPWIIILNKLDRLLADPKNIDSWKDIAGYATLVLNYLERETFNDEPKRGL